MFPVHPNPDSCWLVLRYQGRTGDDLTAEPRNGAQSLGPAEHWVERVRKRKNVSSLIVTNNYREGGESGERLKQSKDEGLELITGKYYIITCKKTKY